MAPMHRLYRRPPYVRNIWNESLTVTMNLKGRAARCTRTSCQG